MGFYFALLNLSNKRDHHHPHERGRRSRGRRDVCGCDHQAWEEEVCEHPHIASSLSSSRHSYEDSTEVEERTTCEERRKKVTFKSASDRSLSPQSSDDPSTNFYFLDQRRVSRRCRTECRVEEWRRTVEEEEKEGEEEREGEWAGHSHSSSTHSHDYSTRAHGIGEKMDNEWNRVVEQVREERRESTHGSALWKIPFTKKTHRTSYSTRQTTRGSESSTASSSGSSACEFMNLSFECSPSERQWYMKMQQQLLQYIQ